MQGRAGEAEALLRRALAAKGDFADAWLLLSVVLDARGDLQGAAESAERALLLKPDYAGALSNYADLLRRLDHAAIFLFIAGSYTPLVLGSLAEEGYWFLATVWLIATAGTVAKCANRLTHPFLSTGLYLGLGWFAVFLLEPLMHAIPPEGLALIVAGGVLYTLGAIVFHLDERVPYSHFG